MCIALQGHAREAFIEVRDEGESTDVDASGGLGAIRKLDKGSKPTMLIIAQAQTRTFWVYEVSGRDVDFKPKRYDIRTRTTVEDFDGGDRDGYDVYDEDDGLELENFLLDVAKGMRDGTY